MIATPNSALSGGHLPDDDRVVEIGLRPQSLAEYVGQERIKERLTLFIEAARARGEHLDHVLFSGPPGLGKTTLAHIIAHELGVPITTTSGPVIERPGDLAAILTNLKPHSVLFIDEIHRLSNIVEEMLYPAMEDFQLDILIGQGPSAKTIKLDLPRFTLVGATTRTGLLTSPLRDRFGVTARLEFYPPEDLKRIVSRSSGKLAVPIDDGGALEIARRARGTPRIANRLLRRVRDYAQVLKINKIDAKVTAKTLDDLGVDKAGLDDLDRKVLRLVLEVYAGGPVGVESVAASLNEEVDTIADTVEPYLLKAGYLKRTSRGRVATKLSFDHFGIKYEKQTELF